MNDIYFSHTTPSYVAESYVSEYLLTKVENEQRITEAVQELMIRKKSKNVQEAAIQLNTLHEIGIGDKIKDNWKKFIEFIKNLFAKFMESLTNLVSSNEKYLEKYKEIILEREYKITFTTNGDYFEGIKRINNTVLPVFSYESFKEDLKREEYGPIVKRLIPGISNDGGYDDGLTLAENCKSYFTNEKAGEKEYGGDGVQPNRTDIYNFIAKYQKIEGICKKDITYLENSMNIISNAASKVVPEKTNESALTWYTEDTDGQQTGNGNTNNDNASGDNSSTLKITNTDPSSNAGSYENRDQLTDDQSKEAINGAKEDSNQEEFDKIIRKWTEVCRAIITAKWTAAEQISKDFIKLIRAHVRSYVGKDSDDTQKGKPQKGTNYAKQPPK